MSRRYRHVKRGETYIFDGRAKMQISGATLLQGLGEYVLSPEAAEAVSRYLENIDLVRYRAVVDDTSWVRPESEFFDGRFVEVK